MSVLHLRRRAGEADELVSPERAAEILRLNRSTIYGYIREGLLPATRHGRRRLFVELSAVRALLQPVKGASSCATSSR